MKLLKSILLGIVLTLFVAACGGGGGGGGGNTGGGNTGGGGGGGSGGGGGGSGGGGGTPEPPPLPFELISDEQGAASIDSVRGEEVFVAFDDNGNGLAVWFLRSGTGTVLVYSMYVPATASWTAAVTAGDASGIWEAKLQGGADSFGLLALRDGREIVAATFAGGALSDFETLETITEEEEREGLRVEDIALAASGEGFAATWIKVTARDPSTGTRTSVARASVLPMPGAGWSAPENLGPEGELGTLGIIGSATGYLAFWEEGEIINGGAANLLVNFYTNGQWQAGPVDLDLIYPYWDMQAASNGSTIELVWLSQDRERVLGVSFSETFQLSATADIYVNADRIRSFRVASNDQDYAVVARKDNEIYAIEKSGGAWGTPEFVSQSDINRDLIELVGGGDEFVAVWTQANGVAATKYAGTWSTTAILSDDTVDQFDDIAVAHDGGDEFTVVWRQKLQEDREFDLAASRISFGPFTPAELIETGSENADEPTVVGDPDGGVQVLWPQQLDDDTSEEVFFARESGGSFQEPTIIASDDLGSSVRITRVLSNAAGRTLAVWGQSRGNSFRQFAAIKDPDGVWGEPVILSDGPPLSFAGADQFATDGDGFAYVLTRRDPTDDDDNDIEVRMYDGVSWSDATVLDLDLRGNVQSTSIASNGSGYAVAWVQEPTIDTRDQRTYGSVYADGAWAGPELLSAADAVFTQSAGIVSNGDGYAVTWDDFRGDAVSVNVYSASGWGGATPIAAIFGQALPSIATDGVGYLVKWRDRLPGDSDRNLYVAVSPTGSAADFGAPERLSPDDGNPPGNGRVAGGPAGYAVAWSAFTGGDGAEAFASTWDGDSWTGPVSIEDGVGPAYIDGIVAGDTGFAVLLVQSDTESRFSPDSLVGNVFDGTDWLGPTLLEDSDEILGDFEDEGGQIAVSGDTYAVTWAQRGEDEITHAWFSSFDGANWNRQQLEEQGTDADDTVIAANADGTFTVLWRQADPDGSPFVRLPWAYPDVE